MGALMRSQNPPQAYLDRAQAAEKYLSPAMIASIYSIAATTWAALIGLGFAGLVYLSDTNATSAAIAAAYSVAAWFRRPDDLISAYLTRYTNMWRIPIKLTHDQRLFKVMLMTGEVLGISISFYYPAKDDTKELKDELYTLTHAAISAVGSMRNSVMSEREIEETLDPALEKVAIEFGLPVLYAEVHEVGKYQEAYTIGQDDLLPVPPLSTGTHG
jgi:hypothetical protein